METRKYRMYGLVPYNLSPIQQGIQYGHSVVEYGLQSHEIGGIALDKYLNWANNDKVFIILNGGTTNTRPSIVTGEPYGTLNQHLLTLHMNGILLSTFFEEDLGDQLTAITFLVDDRVWDTETYPDFEYDDDEREFVGTQRSYETQYYEWSERIGGEKNVFLKEFLKQFRLA